MPQPRKEQITNPKTKFSIFRGNGTVFLSGGPVQNITNTVLDNNYDFFVDNSISKNVGGAETNSPAILYGGYGPFNVTAGSSANLVINGVNGGNPITILIQVSDIITISGSPVLTTSKLANRINTILSGYGVIVPVALNINGQIVLKSAIGSNYSLGDDAYISLGDVTPNFLSLTGFGSGFAEDYGVTAPRLGIITKSTDGRGGIVQLKKNDGSICEAVNNSMLHIGRFVYVPEYPSGGQISARLRAFPGPDINGKKIELTYERQALLPPKIVTYNSNFPALSGQSLSLSFDFNMTGANNPEDYNFSYTNFGVTTTFGSITNASDVVDAINNAYWGGVYFSVGTPQRAAVIFKSSEPYTFELTDVFRIRFNGNSFIEFNPSSSFFQATAGQLATYINNQISFVGQAGQGEAYVVTLPNGLQTVAIRSLAAFNLNSIEIIPSVTAGYEFDLINKFGLTPGLYKPSRIARLYGNDEIIIEPPLGGPATTMTLTCSNFVRDALGVSSTSITLNAAPGIQEVPISSSYGAVPEILEFDQEPDNYDSLIQEFNKISEKPNLNPFDGIKNIVDSVLLDKNGKVDSNFIPRILSFLALGGLKLNQSNFKRNASDTTVRPKIDVPQSTLEGFVLLFETYAQNSPIKIRVYLSGTNVYLTYNAYCDQSGLNWTVDASITSYIIEITNLEIFKLKRKPYVTVTFSDTEWISVTELNSSLTDSIVKLINTTSFSTPLVSTQTSENFQLLLEIGGTSLTSPTKYRIYRRGGGFKSLIFVLNARYDFLTNLWVKDDVAFGSTYSISINENGMNFSYLQSSVVLPSNAWYSAFGLNFITDPGYPSKIKLYDAVFEKGRPDVKHRVFYSEADGNGPTDINAYVDAATIPSFENQGGFSSVFNAIWNESLNRWDRLNPSYYSYGLISDGKSLGVFRNRFLSNWDENNWEQGAKLTYDGISYKGSTVGATHRVPFGSFVNTSSGTWSLVANVSNLHYIQNVANNNEITAHISLHPGATEITAVEIILDGVSASHPSNTIGFRLSKKTEDTRAFIDSVESEDNTALFTYTVNHKWRHDLITPFTIGPGEDLYLHIKGAEVGTGGLFFGANLIYK